MTPKQYNGSCHCGAVKFTIALDIAATGTMKCNCTICVKIRSWEILAKPEDFSITSGSADLTEYRYGEKRFPHYFCKHCGVQTHLTGNIPPLGGELVMVQVTCLDGVDPKEIAEEKIKFFDNLNDKPWEEPEYTKHL